MSNPKRHRGGSKLSGIALAGAVTALAVTCGGAAIWRAWPALAATAAAGAQKPTTRPATQKVKVDPTAAFFTSNPPPRIKLEVAPPELEALRREPRKYVKAKVHELGPAPAAATPGANPAAANAKLVPVKTYDDVGVHVKGALGSFRGVDDRPALTLNFDKFKKEQRFHGLDKLHLNNSVQDPTYLNEDVGGAVFRDAGIPAARVTYATVRINDRDLGLYVVKEGFDSAFLRRNFKNASGQFFEGNLQDIDQALPVKNNTGPKDHQKLKDLLAAANEGDPVKRRQRLDKLLDVDKFLTLLAIEGMLAHWDGYGFNHNNYRIYCDPKSGKMVFLPHGMDQLFGNPGHGLIPGAGVVSRAVVQAPEDQARLMERVRELRENVFTPEKLSKHVDNAAARLIAAAGQSDPNAAAQYKEQAAQLRQRINERIRNIDRQLGVTPKPLKFDAAGVASLAKASWEPGPSQGGVETDRFDEAGKPRLRIRCGNGGGTASWRTAALLPAGRYVFEAQVRPSKVAAPDGPNTGAGLRISGGQRPPQSRLVGTSDWKKAEYEFEVTDPAREVVLVCELKATAGEVTIDPGSLRLRRR